MFMYQYRIHKDFDIHKYDLLLQELGKRSLETKDVPVASILIYNNEVIGKGFNTVLRDSNPAGHAEINAIKDCMSKIGMDKFKSMDKEKLFLISTFEPCPMCLGALEEYNINHVVFALPKKLKEKIRYLKKDIKYYNQLQESGAGRLQYDLFKLHPEFDSTQYKY